ncbi:MAG: hypothetical protein GXP62_14125, partial [Oligoflexia bacterium]|nr:hypothetical protein [Oligoflexia bacterium]
MRAPVLLLLLGLPSTAFAWPADDAWVSFTQGGDFVADLSGDISDVNSSNDIVGEASTDRAAAYWYADADFLYLRMRLNESPWLTTDTSLQSRAWAFQLDTDGDSDPDSHADNYEFVLGLSGPADTFVIYENSTRSGGETDPAETMLELGSVADGD